MIGSLYSSNAADPCVFYHPLFIEAAEVFPAHVTPTHIVVGYQDDVLVFGVPIRLANLWG